MQESNLQPSQQNQTVLPYSSCGLSSPRWYDLVWKILNYSFLKMLQILYFCFSGAGEREVSFVHGAPGFNKLNVISKFMILIISQHFSSHTWIDFIGGHVDIFLSVSFSFFAVKLNSIEVALQPRLCREYTGDYFSYNKTISPFPLCWCYKNW